MVKYAVAAFIAFGAMQVVSAQASPVSTGSPAVQNQVTSNVEKVWHCRRWSGGWGCGGYHHRRWWR